jgi:CRP-like cAMP-binding protein
VCKEGTTGEALFVILRGRVRLCKGDAFITHLGHGAHFGEMALVDRGPRSASVLAEERSRLLLMPRQAFYDVLREEAPLGVKLLWSLAQVLAERLRKTTADLSDARLEAQAIDLSEEAAVEDTDGAG